MTDNQNILSCWHKLEHFSPAIVPNDRYTKQLTITEPWRNTPKPSQTEKTVEFTVYIGVFDADIVSQFVAKKFDKNTTNVNVRKSSVCYAAIKVDDKGGYIKNSFGLSTLPWALGQLNTMEINKNDWASKFENIKNKLTEDLDAIFKEEDGSYFVTLDKLVFFQRKIEVACDWGVIPDKKIVVKQGERFKKAKPSSSDVLNSFYVKDLERIIQSLDKLNPPKAFSQYLAGSLNHSSTRTDLSKDVQALKQNLTPMDIPDGCWPSEYKLSLMQQFAVNTIFNNLGGDEQEGLFSVNGPPGTGKTTLLRDIIAPILVERAKKLIQFNEPARAFTKVGEVKINANFASFIYSPAPPLTQTGIVIASSNNGAVENISKELPQKEAVGKYKNRIAYFKETVKEAGTDWGIFSSNLGNKTNINKLINTLWFAKEGTNLKEVLRTKRKIDVGDWKDVVSRFENKLKEVKREKAKLEDYRLSFLNISCQKTRITDYSTELQDQIVAYSNLQECIERQFKLVQLIKEKKQGYLDALTKVQSTKPKPLIFLLKPTIRKNYFDTIEGLQKKYSDNSSLYDAEEAELNALKIKAKNLNSKKLNTLYNLEEAKNQLQVIEQRIVDAKEELGQYFAGNDFWENIHSNKTSQESNPWHSDELKKLQSELFILSLEVNETFILTANGTSNRISTSLSGFFSYLQGKTSEKPSYKEIKAMWDTFFLVVPVISSTFASIQTLFKDLKQEDIPWLLIDEAGQAIPQAAAGAIWRSKRVAVVGDPFQIEPVVTIPDIITNNISSYFGLNDRQVNSILSVQSMADRINPFGRYLTNNEQEEWIGIPLRVHRRCVTPIFDVANKIAYNGTMFCATNDKKELAIKFESSFIHCSGAVKGNHFVENQAQHIHGILTHEISNSENLPDVYIISPFSEISRELKTYLKESLSLEFPDLKEKLSKWINSNIGTVHTFQGKEAEGVILCLGLDETKKSAANWASQKPNLLNVAITRAKYRFIAIGDENIWLKQPFFEELKNIGQVVMA